MFSKTNVFVQSLLSVVALLVLLLAGVVKSDFPTNTCLFYTIGYYDGLYSLDAVGPTYAGCRVYRAHSSNGGANSLYVFRLHDDNGGFIWYVGTNATEPSAVQMAVSENNCCPPDGLVLKADNDSKYDTTIVRAANTVGRYPVSQLKSGKVSATPLDYSAEVTAVDPLECVQKQLDVDKYITGVSYSKSTSKCYPIYDNTVTTVDNSDFITAAFSDIAALNGKAKVSSQVALKVQLRSHNPTDCVRMIIDTYFRDTTHEAYPNGYWVQRAAGQCYALFDARMPYEYYTSYDDLFGYIVPNQFGQTGPTRTTTISSSTIATTTPPPNTTKIATNNNTTTVPPPTTTIITNITPAPPASLQDTTTTSTTTLPELPNTSNTGLVIGASCAGAVVLLGGGYYLLRRKRSANGDEMEMYGEGGEYYDYNYQ